MSAAKIEATGETASLSPYRHFTAGEWGRLRQDTPLPLSAKELEELKGFGERISLDDAAVLAVLEKMIKQRRDSAQQYRDGGRPELAEQEDFEIGILSEYMPQPLSDDDIAALIEQAMAETGAAGMADMGKVMGWLKPRVAGRADMGSLSARIKARLN